MRAHPVGLVAQPGDNVLDVVDVLLALRLRVGVVKAQVAVPAVALRIAKVHEHGLPPAHTHALSPDGLPARIHMQVLAKCSLSWHHAALHGRKPNIDEQASMM